MQVTSEPAVSLSDADQVRAAHATTTAQLAELLRTLPPAATTARADRLAWSVGETAAHLVLANLLYVEFVGGQRTPWTAREIGTYNADLISLLPERNCAVLAEQLLEAAEAFRAATAGHADESLPWYGGQKLTTASMTAVVLGELLIHGRDIARGAGRPWPIDADAARRVIGGVAPVLPQFVNFEAARGLTATYDIQVRGGPRFVAEFRAGTLRVLAAPRGSVDCHILADPVAFLLVAYGRVNQWQPILRAQLLAWGRRPWLGLQFKGLLHNP
jgi:uncharacterized protein (TIGR03083 family)